MAAGQSVSDTEVEVSSLQRDLRALVKQLTALIRLKPTSPDFPAKLERVLATLPTPDTIKNAVEEVRQRAAVVLAAVRQSRVDDFRRMEADVVGEARKAGKPVRESDQGWRIEEVEIRLRRADAMTRIFYNREPLTEWSPIGSRNHLDLLLARARAKLQAVSLSDERLREVYWRAYEQGTTSANASLRGRVRLTDLFRNVQAIVTPPDEKAQGSKGRKRQAFPRFAFLYNLDRYRRIAGSIAVERRLLLETGSQKDSAKFGMVLNGLDAAEDYRVYCYAALVTQAA